MKVFFTSVVLVALGLMSLAILQQIKTPTARPIPLMMMDSLMYTHVDCLECRQKCLKQVNIINAKGEIIASYYDSISVAEDTSLLNHSKIPE